MFGIRNAIEVHTRRSTTCVLDQRGDLSCIGVLDEDHAPEPKLRRVFSGARRLSLWRLEPRQIAGVSED